MTGELITKLLITNGVLMLTAGLIAPVLINADVPSWLTNFTLMIFLTTPFVFVAILLVALWM